MFRDQESIVSLAYEIAIKSLRVEIYVVFRVENTKQFRNRH